MTVDALHPDDEAVAYGRQLGLALAVAVGHVALDVDHLVHGADRLVGDLGEHVDVALVAAEAACGGGRGIMRAFGSEQGDLAGGLVQLLRLVRGTADVHLHRGLGGDGHQARDDHQHAVGDLHQPGLRRLSVLRDDRDQHRRADQVLPHLCDLATEVGDGAAELQHVGGIGRVAGAHGVLAELLQFLLAAVQRDLPCGDLDLQPVQAASYGGGLLVEQVDRDGEVRLRLAGFCLLLVHQVEEFPAAFAEALEGGVGVRGGAHQPAEQAFPRAGLAPGCPGAGRFGLQVLDAQDLHALDHGCGDAPHLSRVAKADAGEQLAGGLGDLGQHPVAMREQGRGLAEVDAAGRQPGLCTILGAQVADFDEAGRRGLGDKARIDFFDFGRRNSNGIRRGLRHGSLGQIVENRKVQRFVLGGLWHPFSLRRG